MTRADAGEALVPRQAASGLLEGASRRVGAPMSTTFQVTDRCNYQCSHCFQEHDRGDELTTEECIGILRQVADAGVLFLTLMGGEFFMRRDADQLLKTARELGFAIRLKSTGHHITDKRADLLASLRPLQVDLSLYSARETEHEWVTRQPGSWQRTVDAARRLVERGISVELKGVVMEHTAADILDLAGLADELGASYSLDPKIVAMENGDGSPLVHRMSAGSLARFYGDIRTPELLRAAGPDGDWSTRNRLDRSPCGAGHFSCFINPRGEVWPCIALPIPVGDLRKDTFLDIWREADGLQEVRELRWASIAECNVCPVRQHCQRCHGMALTEHGVLRGPSLEACRHAVATRDALRNAGAVPATDTAMPPTWDRVDVDGQHPRTATGRRSRALRILE